MELVVSIDWAHFTPFSALAGGALIGLAAAALLVLGLGRVLGAAGVVGGALEIRDAEAPWRWSLIVGLVLSPFVARALWSVAPPVFAASWLALVAAGLLVGIGARLGSAAPAATASAAWRGCRRARSWRPESSWRRRSRPCSSPATSSAEEGDDHEPQRLRPRRRPDLRPRPLPLGHVSAGQGDRLPRSRRGSGTLRSPSSWAARSSSPCRPSCSRAGAPPPGSAARSICRRRAIDAPLVVGSGVFGVGWGLGGVCPAPGVVDLGFFSPGAAVFVVSMAAGMLIYRAAAGRRLPGLRLLAQDA